VTGPTTENDIRQRHLDRSMRRYLEACKTLAKIQKQDLPNIQVNLAENQVVAPDGIKAVRGVPNRGR
jgi:hypothetical protein